MATDERDDEPVRPRTAAERTTIGRFGTTARADAYNAWAERLRAKRVANQARIREARGDGAGEAGPDYWSTDALFSESRRVEEEEQQTGAFSSTDDLLAVFNLAAGATLDNVTASYRRLAKLHHPDRYALADADTQARHEEQMRIINTAYRSLRERLGP